MDKNSNKVALVTGAGRGIGRSIALTLAQKAWAVVVNFRGNHAAADEVKNRIENAGGKCSLVQADVSQAKDREKLLTETLAAFGRIDLLVNNAGMAPRTRDDLLDLKEADYEEVLDVNLKGPFFLTQVVAKQMISQDSGEADFAPKIINIGSVSAYASSPNRAAYCLSKAGVAMMTKLFADRLAAHDVLVYEIRPGIIETDMTAGVKEKYDALIGSGLTPIQRWGKSEDVSSAVLAIAEGAFPFSTGEVFNVDGGFHLRRL